MSADPRATRRRVFVVGALVALVASGIVVARARRAAPAPALARDLGAAVATLSAPGGGDAAAVLASADACLAKTPDDARCTYARAVALERLGRFDDAWPVARKAEGALRDRDSRLLVVELAIVRGDLDVADALASALVAERPDDAAARYDAALVADKRGRFNPAREGYLAALRADPKLASARYNLALLTYQKGALDEARHHVERFLADYPTDPRGASLVRAVGRAAPAGSAR